VKTLHLSVDITQLEAPENGYILDRAAVILRSGGLVAMPTETVYGLGANAFDAQAVARIFEAKQRPSWDPVIVHVCSLAMLETVVREIPDTAKKLIAAFWPGPLTLLLPRAESIPDAVTAGRPLVGVRMPSHPVALELIRRAGVPIAAPSANLFSRTSPTTAKHVLDDLDGRIEAVIDSGPTIHGVESTVMDPGQSPMMIYRPGAVTRVQIRDAAGPVEVFHAPKLVKTPREALPSPGVGIRHYAPKARLILIEAPFEELPDRLAKAAAEYAEEQVGIMLPTEISLPETVKPAAVFAWGHWAAPRELARKLFAGLRALDARECTVILCPLPPPEGIGAAIRDRLGKAGSRDTGTS
jgi:L-threonylcarbamoyladenylate synthase